MNKIILISLIIILLLSFQQTSAEESCLILNFDDGYSGVYLNAFSIMKDYEMPGVIFVPTATINKNNHLTLLELKELKNHGWEIGSHTVNHPNLLQLTCSGIEREIIKSKQYLYKNGLIDNNYSSFCSPMAKWNSMIADSVNKNYYLARCDKLINCKNNQEINSTIKVVLKTTTLISIKNWINKSCEKNIPLILVFHDINKNVNHLYNFSPARFAKLINYIQNNNIKVITFKEFLQK